MTDFSTSATLQGTSPDPDLQPGQQVGEYVVESKLGQGGFGAVFKATHPVIGKVVALKVLARKFSVDPDMVERFVAEARAVNQIRHRNIIDIFSFGQLADGRHYYAMEYLDGDPLDAIVEREGKLSLADALPVLRAMARALDACHAKGIAHRDLKPANIFVAKDPDGDRFPKLLDFGIAKLMGPEETVKSKTRTGIPMGTPYYMSPEQCRGRDVDHRTDYYAFGVVAYEMLTGRVPFDGDDFMSILMSQINDAPQPPSSLEPSLGRGVDDAILWLMQKEPRDRPPSLISAVQALEQASGIAARDSAPYEAARPEDTSPPNTTRAVGAGADTMMPHAVPAKRRSNAPIVFGAIGAIVVAAVVAVVLVATKHDAKPVAPAPPSPPVAAAPPVVVPPAPTPPPATPVKPVTITIAGVPDGTEVVARGQVIGTAPGPIQLDRGGDPVVLTFRADGYIATSKSVTPDADQPLELTLKAKPKSPTPGRTQQTPKATNKDDIAVPDFH